MHIYNKLTWDRTKQNDNFDLNSWWDDYVITNQWLFAPSDGGDMIGSSNLCCDLCPRTAVTLSFINKTRGEGRRWHRTRCTDNPVSTWYAKWIFMCLWGVTKVSQLFLWQLTIKIEALLKMSCADVMQSRGNWLYFTNEGARAPGRTQLLYSVGIVKGTK